jgi:alpha-ketoglutarate-dependent taurine dioxygenase
MTVRITAMSDAVGVAVRGFSSRSFRRRAAADQCLELLTRHGVVVYPEVHITDADLVTFSRMLGQVVDAGIGGHPDFPEISPITLDPAKSKLATLRRSTVFWHADGLTDDVPQKASLLTAREIADVGGATEFANTYAAFEALPDHKKEELAQFRVVHSLAASQLMFEDHPNDDDVPTWEHPPVREHPLVWRHRDGRCSLLIGNTAGGVIGMSDEEGSGLLDSLLAWSTQKRFVLHRQWRVGDLVVWDNTSMLHRAIPYDSTSRRLMHRTSLVGEEAVTQ